MLRWLGTDLCIMCNGRHVIEWVQIGVVCTRLAFGGAISTRASIRCLPKVGSYGTSKYSDME